MTPNDLADAGTITILLTFIAAMVGAFLKGLIVPGWLYRQEQKQRLVAEEQAAKNTDALTLLAKAMTPRKEASSGT